MYRVFVLLIIIVALKFLTTYSSNTSSMPFKINNTSIPHFFINNCKKNPDRKALCAKLNGNWTCLTYKDYLSKILLFAKALSIYNLEKQASLCIIGHNTPAWLIGYMGGIFHGTKVASIDPSAAGEIMSYIIRNSYSSVLFIDKKEIIKKIDFETLENVQLIIVYDDTISHTEYNILKSNDVSILTFNQFLLMGDFAKWTVPPTKFYERKIASIVYTSGTTGLPKGVVLTHRNILSSIYNMVEGVRIMGIEIKSERIISYLPLNHIAAQMMDIYMSQATGSTLYFADKKSLRGSILDYILEIKPTVMLSVPRLWEKMRSKIEENVSNTYFLKILSPYIRRKVGLNECKLMISGAAPLSKDTSEFYENIGLPLLNAYGMTETTGPIAVGYKKLLTKLPLNKIEIRKNEIIVSGPCVFSGYYGMEPIGDEFKTGDLGKVVDKKLELIGRSKDIIITQGGENISPAPIEHQIKKLLPEADYVVLIGNNRKFLGVLINCRKRLSNSKIEQAVTIVNKNAPTSSHKIKKFVVVPDRFSYESGELTNTLKVKRNIVEQKYGHLF